EAPKDPGKLNDAVKVPGKAVSYSGVPIGGAKFTYRVTREVRYPGWYGEFYWWRPVPVQPAQEIAHGTGITEMDGTFTVTFTAKPDPKVPEWDDPSFRYTVTVDVTDTTGETRTGSKSVEVGYAAMRAEVKADEWQVDGKDVALTVTTKTLDGEPLMAKGTVKVFKLKQPTQVTRPEIDGGRRVPRPVKGQEPKPDASRPVSWELGEVAFSADFTADGAGKAVVNARLPAGIYRAVVDSADKFGKAVSGKAIVQVLNPQADKFPVKVANVVTAESWKVEPGGKFTLFWGTGYDTGRAFIEVEHRQKITQAFWTEANRTQHVLTVPVTEDMRGGFTVRVTQVRENRAYLFTKHVDVPWSNKDLTVKWERFVSKLEPGKKETFTAVISGPDAKKAVAEMVAAMYDASLDAFLPHNWMQRFGVFRRDHSNLQSMFENVGRYFNHVHGSWPHDNKTVDLRYRGFPGELTQNYQRYEYFGKGGGYDFGGGGGFRGRGFAMGPGGEGMAMEQAAFGSMPAQAASAPPGRGMLGDAPKDAQAIRNNTFPGEPLAPNELNKVGQPAEGPALDGVAARKNLAETAFFFPHLSSDADGTVRMEFTMPEALTKWKFLGFAHDKDLKSGFVGGDVVTAKDLMAQPNPPRFLREGDIIEFTTKISNQSATRQTGKVRISLKDARTEKALDADFGLNATEQAFDLPAGESKAVAWRLTVPDGVGPVTYKVVAASERLSDGEEGVLPVLSKRVLVTESLPLPIRNAGSKNFDFTKLRLSGESNTIKHQQYTVQMVSQPAWYAV
ncbi:MAG TPA: alpha-2-macroglobulin family protein, partial [Gemmataceae bacterium]|nr:alpha-2-macroglobulin family protein [Gemmataceae bacterium]